MTEKRFTMDNGSNEDVCLVDNVTGIEYESNFRDIVDLMNELNDENENLKARFHRERDIAMKLGRECDTLFIKNRELEKENRQLEKSKMEIANDLGKIIDENEQLKNANESLSDFRGFINIEHIRIKDENEQLKQFQNNVAEVINSKMGDNVCNDYKMEVLKEIWNELELDEVWFE